MEGYFKSHIHLNSLLWKKIRKSRTNIPIPERADMSSRAFEINNLLFEDIIFPEQSEVDYEFVFKDGLLKEKIRIIHMMERVDVDWSQTISVEDYEAFSKTMNSYYGVMFVGSFPNHMNMNEKKTEETLRETLKMINYDLGVNFDIKGTIPGRIYARYFPNGHFSLSVLANYHARIENEEQLLGAVVQRMKDNMSMLPPIIAAIEKNKLRNMFSGQRSDE